MAAATPPYQGRGRGPLNCPRSFDITLTFSRRIRGVILKMRTRTRTIPFYPISILRKEVLKVGCSEAAGKAFFAKYIGDGLGFALLQFPNFFFNSPWRD